MAFYKKAPAAADKKRLQTSEYLLKNTRIILAPLKNSSMKYNTQVSFKYSTAMHETCVVAISSTACCATVVAHVIFRLHPFVLAQGFLAVHN